MQVERRTNTLASFQESLRSVNENEPDKRKRIAVKTEALKGLYETLRGSKPQDVLAFGVDLHEAIQGYDASDSVDKAFGENRAVFRSWHAPGALEDIVMNSGEEPTATESSSAKAESTEAQGESAHIGFDGLNVLLNPERFRAHKTRYKEGVEGVKPILGGGSTLLHDQITEPLVFSDEYATVTTLLPEEHYAAFFAYNEVAKELKRGQKAHGSEGHDETISKNIDLLAEHAQSMRASVTRPVYFDSEDIGSWTVGIADRTPGAPLHVRKAHHDNQDSIKLKMNFTEKLQDPKRINAMFYQSFMDAIPGRKRMGEHAWNEMVVKYRSTGHMVAQDPSMTTHVPVLEGREPLKGFNPIPTKTGERHVPSYTKPISPVDSRRKNK